jgi:hypothetical protein
MRIILIICFCLIIGLYSCFDNNSKDEMMNEELYLTISNAQWYTTTEQFKDNLFGFVHLNLSGSSNGASIRVSTYGDGVYGEVVLNKNDNIFSGDVIIQFTHIADNIPRKYHTEITAYIRNDYPIEPYKGSVPETDPKVTVNLESDDLVFIN